MDLELKGKSALLIGAGRGIGAATALALAREGCSVALVARSSADLEARKFPNAKRPALPDARAIAADATDAAQLQTAIDLAGSGADWPPTSSLATFVGGSPARRLGRHR